MSQRYVREMMLAISTDELTDLIRERTGITPGALEVEGVTLQQHAGGTTLMVRISHLKAPITPVGGQLQYVTLKVLEEDYR